MKLALMLACLLSFSVLAHNEHTTGTYSCVDSKGKELLSIDFEERYIKFQLRYGNYQEATINAKKSEGSYIEIASYHFTPENVTTYEFFIDLEDGYVSVLPEDEEVGFLLPWSFNCFMN